VDVPRSIALYALLALAEIGGAYLFWLAIREGRAWWLALLGALVLCGYGVLVSLQPDPNFGRILAAYGGVFIAASLAWGMAFDGFRPDRFDLFGAAICLVGVGVIMYSPR
jgi:small multidrug resistance family-3 protein